MRTLIIEFSTTTGCNLKCQYCYSSHKPEYMHHFNLVEFENRIEPIMKYYNCDTYHISYFGGEPLLNWDIIKQSLPEFRKSPKCSSIVLISNGLLLDAEKTVYLKKFKCGLSWSFDGLWSKYRTTNLTDAEAIMKYALELTSSCKVMVSPLSRNYTENLKYFISKGIYHPDFSLVRDDIWTRKNIEYFAEQMRELSDFIITYNLENANNHYSGNMQSQKIVTTGLHSLYALDAFAGAKFGKRNHGCFVGSNGILYATDGSIWPCERFRSNSTFQLAGFINSQNSQNSQNPKNANIHYSDGMQNGDGCYSVNYENLKFLKKISNPQDYPKCKNCELYKYCNAGCTYSQLKIPNADIHSSVNLHNSHNSQICEIIEPLDCVCELQRICYKEALRVFKNAGKSYENYIYKLFENAK